MVERDYKGRLTILPSDLTLPDNVRHVEGEDEQSRRTWAEISNNGEERARERWFGNMEGLRPYWNMPLD